MDRRTLLAVCLGTLSGCQAAVSSGGSDGGPSPSATRNCADGVVVDELYPREVDRDYVDYEYVRLENAADCPADVTGFTVDYGDGNEYAIPELELEPGAGLVVLSRDGENSSLETSPPVYIRSAAFGEGPDASVMDGSGTVRLRNEDGDVIDERSYDECDPPERDT